MSRASQREALDRLLGDFQSRLHTSFPARVESYDASAQTVDLKPAIKREVATDDPEAPFAYEAFPILRSIPVMWPRAGGFAFTMPIAVGDWMLVVCSEQSTLAWRRTGQPNSAPAPNDPHGLNGCFAISGAFPDKNKLSDVSTSDLEIRSEDGDVVARLKSASLELEAAMVRLGSSSAAQSFIKGDQFQTAFNTWKTALDTLLGFCTGPTGGQLATYTTASTALTTALSAALSTKVKGE